MLFPGSGGSLVTSAGIWTFGTVQAGSGSVLLNGQPVVNGFAAELCVANGGNLFIYSSQSGWFEWTLTGWSGTAGPVSPPIEVLKLAENAAASPMGIFTPSDSAYSSSQLTATAVSLPNNGTVFLPDGGTPVSAGEALTVAQLTGLVFKPAPNTSGASSFTYSVSQPGGLTMEVSETVIVTATPPTTIAALLTVNQNAAATPIKIAAPNDTNYATSQLAARILSLPNNGTVLLSDGTTSVSVGETLTISQLTGLEFKPTSNIASQASVLEYAVTDPGNGYALGTASLIVGPSPIQVSVPALPSPAASGMWHDPPSQALGGVGIEVSPTAPQPSQAGDIVGLSLQNAVSSTEASGYVSFGQVFRIGDVQPSDSLVARIGGVNYAVQMNVKSTNADGSVRQAVLTLDAPAIAANSSLQLMLAKGTATALSPTAPSASALLASGYNLGVSFTFHNPDGTTTTDSASAASALQAVINAGTVSTWLSGPAVNEYDVVTTVDGGKLKVEFDIRAYANGTTTTDVIFDNSWMFSPGKTGLNYDVSINQAGQQVYSATGVNQYLYSLWDHQVASPGSISPNVQYDVPYLIATGAIQSYDTSLGVSDSAIQYNYAGVASQTGPMGTAGVGTQMQSTGGRQDIGPQPNWTAQWLLSQNAIAAQVMMADAAASGSVPWHYTDESTSKPINGQTYPNFTIGEGYSGFLQPANGWPTYNANGDPWVPDPAHMPDLNYVPYLITGSHYQLELLQAQADYAINMVFASGGGTLDSSGTVPLGFTNPNYNQPRGLAWGLRTVAEAAYLTPDSDPLKSYFVSELSTAMTGLVQEYINDNFSGQYGQLKGVLQPYLPNSYQGLATPWEDDFVVTSLAEVAGMNIPQASADAVAMLKYMNNWVSGLYTNGSNGFNPLNGPAYVLALNDPITGAPYTTWSQLYEGNVNANWQGGEGGFPPSPTSLLSATQTMGGYGPIAKAALADEITYTQSPQAIQAYGFVVSQIAYAFSLGGSTFSAGSGGNLTAAYQNYPQFSIAPKLPDGVYLQNSQMQIDTSGASTVNLTASGGDSLLAVVGSGTATLNGGSGSSDLMFGGTGTATFNPGLGNDYLFAAYNATGTQTFNDNTGNNYMYGSSAGPNIYVFAESNSGHDTVANFNLTTDRVRIGANLNGNSITSASQLIAGATVNNGNTVLHLSSKDDITLLGVSQPSNLLNSILVS
jgi:hypothetical protein